MSNDHIAEYLKYYIDLPPSPGYAVMINGPWGVGKTYFIKAVVKGLKQSGKKAFWVSLYGVQSTDEIDQRLIAALTPYLLSTAQKSVADQAPIVDELVERGQPYFEKMRPWFETVTKYGGRIGSALIKRTGAGALIQASGLRNVVSPDLIIFDDLERGALKAEELLGYINQFVELEGRKVVIVANEKEIESSDPDYRRIREKVIGQTFDFQEDIEPALQAFIKGMSNAAARSYVEKNIESLRSILTQGECKSLRVVRQVLLTWDRFYPAIDPALRERANPMLTVFRLFMAICTEVRLGRLSAADLTNRVFKIVSGNMEKEDKSTSLALADARFPELQLHDTVLTDDALIHSICQGRIDKDEINQSLRESGHFKTPENEPAWQKVWWGIGRDPAEFETAFAEMEKQFSARKFLEPGAILHVFGLRLWGVQIEQLKIEKSEVVAQCRTYVDDLAKDGKLLAAAADPDAFRHGAADGLGFNSVETDEFKNLWDYLWKVIEKAKEQAWPKQAAALMELMKSDVSAFFAKVAWTNDARENTYQNVPLLSSIPAAEFVERLMQLQPEDFRTALTALKGRYQGGKLKYDLQAEKAWLGEVENLLLKKAKTEVPIRRFAIRNDVTRLLSPFLGDPGSQA